MPAPARWRGHDSRTSSADASSWSDSDDDESSASTASRFDDVERSSDAISVTARRVLADLEQFFDHELFASDCDDDDSDGTGSNQSCGGGGAISLDELSVVLNASIQRHRPVAAASNAMPAVALDPSKAGARTLQSSANRTARRHHQQRNVQQLPFAHSLDLREQKMQLFRAECREARQRSQRQSSDDDVQSPERGRWSVDSSDASSSAAMSFKEDDELSEHWNAASEDRAPVASSDITRIGPRERYTPSMRSSGNDVPKSLNARDALTQATLMRDQSQQTSAPKRQVAERWTRSSSTSRAQSTSHRGSFLQFECEDEVKVDDNNSVDRTNTEGAEQSSRHRSWTALSVHSLAHSSPRSSRSSKSSSASSASSASERSDSEIERVARIHHDRSRHRHHDRHQPRSALPQAQAAPAPRQEVALAQVAYGRTNGLVIHTSDQPVVRSLSSLSTHVHSLSFEQAPVSKQLLSTRLDEQDHAVDREQQPQQALLTPLATPLLKPSTWELDLSNFNA